MMVPFESKLLPIYSIIRNMGLNNNALGVVLPAVLTNAMYIFFVKTYCDGLPDDLYEAGKVDGAGILTIYGKIYFPLLTPIIATIVVLDAINVWNDLLWPMIVLTKQSSYTVQIGLQMYNSGASGQHMQELHLRYLLSVLYLCRSFTFSVRNILYRVLLFPE